MFRRKRSDSDFYKEVETHIAMEAERLRQDGLSETDALAAAKKQFGNVLSAQERFHEAGRWLWLDHLMRDLGYGMRVLMRNPGFTAAAVLSLALGIGVNALVFSVVNALVLRPLPVEHPEQLAFLEGKQGSPGQSFPNYRDIRDRNKAFSGLIGYRPTQLELDSRAGSSRIWGYLATGNYFDVLGVQPTLGRFFHQEDDLHPGASPYAVLSYGTWQTRFGGDRDIVGKTIRVNRQPYTVLGVAPREFHGTEVFFWPEVWVPMMMEAQVEVGNPWLEVRETFNTWVIGRLKPGVSAAQAVADLNMLAADLASQYPAANDGLRFQLARPGLVGDTLGGPARAFLIGVLVLAGLVLLTACANLASLLTARGADRQRDTAVRLSIGATRGRIMRQVLTESLVLATTGGAAGFGLATLLSHALSAWHAPMDFPIQMNVEPDWRVFFFACAVSAFAGILFGLAPARHAARIDANAILKGDQSGWGGRRLALRDLLVAVQVALCFVLVSACLLSLRGLQQSFAMNLGFRPEGVSVVGFDLGLAGYKEERGRELQRRALEVMQQQPGVNAAAYSNSVPLSIDQSNTTIYPEEQPHLRTSQARSATIYEISPGFFTTMGIQFLAGRDFTWHDDLKAPRVAVVNRTFAKQIWHTNNPIGRRFRKGPGGNLIEVVGMVEDGKYTSLTETPQPAFFQPMLQQYNTTTTMIVRSSLPEMQMVGKMRQVLAQLDPELPLYGTGSLQQMLGFAFFPMEAAAIALSAFGVLAIMLAITGIHGLVSYAVARRVREIGIRIAVGARPLQVLRLVLGKMMVLVLAGSAIGLVLSLAAGQMLASIVYGASPRDPLVLTGVCLTILLLGLVSCWAPTLRALRIDPTAALRHE